MATEFERQIAAARSLRALRDVLNADGRADDDLSVAESKLMTRLPTFGGEAPRDTWGIFSWDAAHLLVSRDGIWEIQSRHEAGR